MNGEPERISFSYFSDTNSIGISHKENQDSIFASKSSLVFAVADGVGGYQGGKNASEIAVDIVSDRSLALDSIERLRECVREVDARVKRVAGKLGYLGMGTTVSLAKVVPEKNKVITANVGDSPIFLLSGDKVSLLYKDDSLRFEDPSDMWSINQYLGFEGGLTIHSGMYSYSPGDMLLLCSDGISDNILGGSNDFSRISNLLKQRKHAKDVVMAAMEIGMKSDDMSAILVFL